MPLPSVVVVALKAPLRVIVTPDIGVPDLCLIGGVVTFPKIEYVAVGVPVKSWPVIFEPLRGTDLLVGVNMYPFMPGVTV